MSFVNVATDAVAEAAKVLQGIGSGLDAARVAAAGPTAGIAAAAQDEVSIAVAELYGNFGRGFQAVSEQMQAFHDRFVATVGASVGQYASAEAVNFQQLMAGAGIAPAAAIGVGSPVTAPVVNYPTPFGPILLTLSGETTPMGVNVTSGSLQVPTALALAYDSISPVLNVGIALQNGGAAFTNAIQTGNPLAAARAVVQTPVDAVTGFFVGQQQITGRVDAPAYSGYTGAEYSIPVGGLFTPVAPVTLTLFGSSGAVTVLPLSGTRLGGPFSAIGSLLTGGM